MSRQVWEAEMSLQVLAYNLKRVMQIGGLCVRQLLRKISLPCKHLLAQRAGVSRRTRRLSRSSATQLHRQCQFLSATFHQ